MKQAFVATVVVLSAFCLGCQKDEPAQLEGRWTQKSYTILQTSYLGPTQPTSYQSEPDNFIDISAQDIAYRSPRLSGPLNQPYTRQGKKLFIAAGTLNSRIETIEELTDHTLMLRTAQRSGIALQDSLIRQFYYTR
ncbi:hypothetical protein [Hymenobacter tenuis]